LFCVDPQRRLHNVPVRWNAEQAPGVRNAGADERATNRLRSQYDVTANGNHIYSMRQNVQDHATVRSPPAGARCSNDAVLLSRSMIVSRFSV
jgi:hypothetical protein